MNRARIAANGGTVSTSVLIYMALHDDMGFGKKRLDAIGDKAKEYSVYINHDAGRLNELRDRIGKYLDYQLQRDFIQTLVKGLKYSGHEERRGAEAGMEATYSLVFLALHELYGFGAQRLKRIQAHIKEYAWFIKDGTTHVLEYMKCLHCEAGQQYQALEGYEKEHGPVEIYG